MQADAVRFPDDATLLPIDGGALLVSRHHATFCRVPAAQSQRLGRLLADAATPSRSSLAALGDALLGELDRHGFFAPPRPAGRPKPAVQLQLTNACNLACGYCCTNSGRPRDGEVCFEQLRAVVRQIPDAVGPDAGVALLGGEPLLVPWALDLAAEIIDIGLDVSLFTNGLPLSDGDLARRTAALVRRGMQVRVSLAGPSAGFCDGLSGASRFDAALRGVAQLAALGGRATVDLMLTPQQASEVAAQLPNLRRRLPPDTPLALGVLYLSGRETGEHLFAGREALEAALTRIAFEAGETIPAVMPSPVADRREGCDCALGHHIHVRSDGALFGCFKMEEKIGRLDTLGFAAAVKRLRENPLRAAELAACAACPLATLCGAGCRSENLLYTGDANEPPCGPWRVRVLCELLADDCTSALEWPVAFLWHEARRRGIDAPPELVPLAASRHLIEIG